MARETNADKLRNLEEENQKLREMAEQQQPTDDLSRYMSDINFLNRAKVSQTSTNKIVVKDIHDHKNISLWTKWGKRVGPLHPNNAEHAYRKFYNMAQRSNKPWLAIVVNQPTEQEVEAWKKSEEGKKWQAEVSIERARKMKTKKKSEIDRLVSQMQTMYGVGPNEINNISKEPQPLASGR